MKTKTQELSHIASESLTYTDFAANNPIKSRYFIFTNSATGDRRILASKEEVIFAGKYVENPVIVGFRTLEDAKKSLAGPRQTLKRKPVSKKVNAPNKDHISAKDVKDAYKDKARFNKAFDKE